MNRLLNVRLVKVLALGALLSASTVAMAQHGNDRGRTHGYSNGHQGQQRGNERQRSVRYSDGYRGQQRDYDRGRSDGYRGKQHGGKNYGKHGGKHAGKHGRKHHKNRYYVQPKRYGNRHSHNGRYCNISHYPSYVTQYRAPVYIPRPPPVVLYPPRVGLYFGGRIDF